MRTQLPNCRQAEHTTAWQTQPLSWPCPPEGQDSAPPTRGKEPEPPTREPLTSLLDSLTHQGADSRSNNLNGERTWISVYFLGSKITVDSDCSHQIKRCLLLGRKALTNLDSILKSTAITLPTKVHIVKAMVFLVIVYGYESWTIKKVARQRTDASESRCWKRLLRAPWTARRSNQSILKEINSEYSLEYLTNESEMQYLSAISKMTE